MNSNTPPTIAVLGIGLIGTPVAFKMHQRGLAFRAWNRIAAKAQAGVTRFERFKRTLADGPGGQDMAAFCLAGMNPAGASAP